MGCVREGCEREGCVREGCEREGGARAKLLGGGSTWVCTATLGRSRCVRGHLFHTSVYDGGGA